MRTAIALGSNLGERLQHLRRARDELRVLNLGDEPFLCSKIYETEPVDCAADAPAFMNAVIEIGFSGTPEMLLDSLRQIETKLGRAETRPRNAPRPIDLDLLYFGDFFLTQQTLTIPHPRLHERRFVLQPLHDLRPNLVLPGERVSVRELLENLPTTPAVQFVAEF